VPQPVQAHPNDTRSAVLRVDNATRDFLTGIDRASSAEQVTSALSRLGGLFDLPNVVVADSQQHAVVALCMSDGVHRALKAIAAASDPPNCVGVATFEIASAAPSFRVVFFGCGGHVDGLAQSLLHLGAQLASERFKPDPGAKRTVSTRRERQALKLSMAGLTDKEIGEVLGLSTRTVRFHFANATRKARVATRGQLIARHAADLRLADD
jgi:DNA-binding CsgD family transcriptional regulator